VTTVPYRLAGGLVGRPVVVEDDIDQVAELSSEEQRSPKTDQILSSSRQGGTLERHARHRM